MAANKALVIVTATVPIGRIAGTLFTDFLGNGVTPLSADDTPLGGVAIELYQDDGDGIAELGGDDALVRSSTTVPGTGAYGFDDVIGVYHVRQVLPPGYRQTAGLAIYTVTVLPEQDVRQLDFADINRHNFRNATLRPARHPRPMPSRPRTRASSRSSCQAARPEWSLRS